MNAILDLKERLIDGIGTFGLRIGQRRDVAPRVTLASDVRKTVIEKFEVSVLVDRLRIRWLIQAKSRSANFRLVFESGKLGDERKLGLGNTGRGLDVAPLSAVLIRPAPPCGVVKAVLLVECDVVLSVFLDEFLTGGVSDVCDIVVSDPVQHAGSQVLLLLSVATGVQKFLNGWLQ